MPARSSYHRGVVAEAITNMLAHRDLALRDLPSRVHVFDHSLEFVNSRRSVGFSPVAQKAIRYGMPERLNPRLAAVLTSSAYGLKLTLRGLPALLREAKRFSSRKAEIVSFNDEFRLKDLRRVKRSLSAFTADPAVQRQMAQISLVQLR